MFEAKLKQLREEVNIPQRKVAALDIDTATCSKIENGLFTLRKDFIPIIEEFYGLKKGALTTEWLADKVLIK